MKSKRIIFTTDAKLSVKTFAAPVASTSTATDASSAPVESIATLRGYPIVWNAVSSDRGGYKVRLLPGSARFTTPCLAFWHHDASQPVGNTANVTLRFLPADDYGIPVEIDLPDTTTGRDAEELVENRYVTGMSFAMVDAPTATEVTENGETILNVSDFLCDEVTITAIPAFVETSIEVAEDNVPEDEGEDTADAPAPADTGAMSLSAKSDKAEVIKERTAQSLKLQKIRQSMYALE